MRKVLAVILDYFVIIAGGTIIGLLIYNQYFNSICLVAGKHYSFTKEALLNGIFQTLPVIFMLLGFTTSLYKIRHRSAPKSTFTAYCVLSLLTWFLFFPLTLTLQTKISDKLSSAEEIRDSLSLSGDYFRKSDGSTYYFRKDSSEKTAEVLQLLDSEHPEKFPEEKIISIDKDSDFYKDSFPFRDPVLKDSMSDIPYEITGIFYSLKKQALSAWNNGLIAWLCFCSLGLALCSVYAFIKFSAWRMVNAFCVLASTGLLLWFNYFYFTPGCRHFRAFVCEFFYDTGRFGFFINRNIDFPLMLINLTFGLLASICGIVLAILRNQESN